MQLIAFHARRMYAPDDVMEIESGAAEDGGAAEDEGFVRGSLLFWVIKPCSLAPHPDAALLTFSASNLISKSNS